MYVQWQHWNALEKNVRSFCYLWAWIHHRNKKYASSENEICWFFFLLLIWTVLKLFRFLLHSEDLGTSFLSDTFNRILDTFYSHKDIRKWLLCASFSCHSKSVCIERTGEDGREAAYPSPTSRQGQTETLLLLCRQEYICDHLHRLLTLCSPLLFTVHLQWFVNVWTLAH